MIIYSVFERTLEQRWSVRIGLQPALGATGFGLSGRQIDRRF